VGEGDIACDASDNISRSLASSFVINMSPEFLVLADNIKLIFYAEEALEDYVDMPE
jgi:hypothetical protein